MPLSGIDVSNYQTSATLSSWLPKVSFVIVKASEGATYVDPRHLSHVSAARSARKLVGHYHFARPDNNSAVTEADFFVRTAAAKPGEVMVLDFEPYNHPGIPSTYPEWILAFTARVKARTGAPCWLYCDGNMLGSIVLPQASSSEAAAMRRQPLWKAAYASDPGSLLGWPTLTAWQRTATPIDQDVFYGDSATWRALAIPFPSPPKPPAHQETDMKLTDIVPGTEDLSGGPLTVAQCFLRGAWGYDQVINGGSIDNRLDSNAAAIAALEDVLGAKAPK